MDNNQPNNQFNNGGNQIPPNNQSNNYNGGNIPPNEPKKDRFKSLKNLTTKQIIKICLVVLVVFSLSTNAFLMYHYFNDSDNTYVSTTRNATVKEVDYDVKTDTTEVIKKVQDSVVGVLVYSNTSNNSYFNQESSTEESSGSGSGVVFKVDGKTVYIITNNHVIENSSKVEIVFSNSKKVEATVVGSDSYSDVAVLKCQPSFSVNAIDIGDSSLLDKGETVLAIGSPLGIEYAGTVTQGIVSAKDRTVSVDLNGDNQDDWDMNVIQTDAPINPGNSGGALVNTQGELVGITSMKLASSSVEGMGFAIPINDVMKNVNQILVNGKVSHPTVGIKGVSLSDYSSWELESYGIEVDTDKGIYITEVISGGAASSAGLQKGDIIVKFDGKSITSYKAFLTALYSKNVGDKVSIVVNRSGSEKTFTITLKDNG